MITENIRSAGSLEDALYALAVAKSVPDAAALDDIVRQYPEHAAELTDMAIALALDSLADRIDEPVLPEVRGRSKAVAKAMSRFHNRLYVVRASGSASKAKAASAVANPFAGLGRAELRDLAGRLGANTVFAMKLRDAVIDPGTMTAGFRQHVAEKSQVPLDVLAAHFARPMQVALHGITKRRESPPADKSKVSRTQSEIPASNPNSRLFFWACKR
jgi:hypothetical protein